MKNTQKKIFFIAIVVTILFSIVLVPKNFQNDTFFTIALGNDILEKGVRGEESLVWHEGLEFTNPRWLFDVLIAKIYNISGFNGIYIFTLIMTFFIIMYYFIILNKLTNKNVIALLCSIFELYFTYYFFSARAQIISILIFMIEFYCIERLVHTNKNRYLVTLLILPVILVNIHASVFPIYFIMFIPYIVEKILSKVLEGLDCKKLIIESSNLKKVYIAIVGSFFIGLFLKPSTIQTYTYIFKNFGGLSREFISELLPLTLINNLDIIVLLGILFSVLILTEVKIRIIDIFYILGFFIMSLTARRSLLYFHLISTLCIYRILSDAIDLIRDEIKKKMPNPNEEDIKFINFIKITIYGIFVIIIIYLATKVLIHNYSATYVPEEWYPVGATEYILENIDQDEMRIYNDFNFGSYLEFKGIKAFIDSRSEIYTPEFNEGCTILEDWYNTVDCKINYNETFDKYNITHVLIKKDQSIYNFINYDEKWNLIYEDEYFVLYERNT